MTRSDHAAVLMRNMVGQVVDISPSGCLIQSRRRLEVGTVGRLHLTFETQECADDVEVVHCEEIAGARSLYRVGLRFLWTTPRDVGSIRHAVKQHADNLETSRPIWVM